MLLFLIFFPIGNSCKEFGKGMCATCRSTQAFTGVSAPTEQPDAQVEAEEAGLVSLFHICRNACAGAHLTVNHISDSKK